MTVPSICIHKILRTSSAPDTYFENREQCLSPYLFLRPEKLPEFDDFKSNSISAETMTFFKRVAAVVPDSFDVNAREKFIEKYLASDAESFPRYAN